MGGSVGGGDGSGQGVRDARVVEIVVALVGGALAGLLLVAAMVLFGWLATPPRELWGPVIQARQPLAVALGVLVGLWWLVRARRRGL